MIIRKASLKDKDEVVSIYNEAKMFIKSYNSPQWQDGTPNEKSFFEDLKNDNLYVNEVDNNIVAVATILKTEKAYLKIDGAWLNDEDYVVIHRIATKVNHHKKGYAKAFLNYIYETLGYANIKIDTHELNEPMKRFLSKNGFIYCGIVYLDEDKKKRLAFQKTYN